MAASFHYVTLRTFAHATEDVERVKEALLFAAGSAAEIADSIVEGHHKNPIHVFEVELRTRGAIDRFFERIARDGDAVVETLARQLDERLGEDQVFYFRLGKQDAYQQALTLTTGEDAIQVRAKVAAFPAKLPAARRVLSAYFDALATAATSDA